MPDGLPHSEIWVASEALFSDFPPHGNIVYPFAILSMNLVKMIFVQKNGEAVDTEFRANSGILNGPSNLANGIMLLFEAVPLLQERSHRQDWFLNCFFVASSDKPIHNVSLSAP